MTFQVAIPSYHRAEMLGRKSLPLLLGRGVGAEQVTVFVADEAEAEAYAGALEPGSYGSIVVAAPGLGPARNVIAEHYPAGTAVLSMDDDVDDLVELAGDRLVPVADVAALVREAFATCRQLGLRLWGVYPVPNAFFMRPRSTTDLRLVAGPFWGALASPGEPDVTHITLCPGGEKEDHERTLRYFEADGGVLRLGHVAVKTRWYKNPGGLQDTRTRASEDAAVAALLGRWPHLLRVNPGRKSGFPELRFVQPTRGGR